MKKKRNKKVKIIPFADGATGTVHEGQEKNWRNWKSEEEL